MATHVYSVWGLPQEDVRTRAKKVMDTLRLEFGGPEFDPHVTVVGAIRLSPEDALDKFKSACKGVKAYTAHGKGISAYGKGISTGTFLYKCVFLLLEPTPEVVGTNDHCCAHFGYNRTSTYMPHMSLLYVDLTEEQKKKAEERVIAFDEGLGNLSFGINRLALYKTNPEDKTLKSWEKVAECDLEAP